MEHYIMINGHRIELTKEQVKQIIEANDEGESIILADVPVGEVTRVGGYELLVLEQMGESTVLICKDLIGEKTAFGEHNNYDGSYVDEICNSFSEAIADFVGEDNIVSHVVDLTSDDGLTDYGSVVRRCSLLTAELYRNYVEILDKFKLDEWWWLATPHSTKRHGNDNWVKCVSPSGCINDGDLNFDFSGVRPFCILKSTIFVSK